MTVHKLEHGGFAISDDGGWLPGSYATEEAAEAALKIASIGNFDTLQSIADEADGVIELKDVAAKRQSQIELVSNLGGTAETRKLLDMNLPTNFTGSPYFQSSGYSSGVIYSEEQGKWFCYEDPNLVNMFFNSTDGSFMKRELQEKPSHVFSRRELEEAINENELG